MSILNLKTLYFTTNYTEYSIITLYLTLISIISIILVLLSYLAAEQKADAEKISIYECRFEPYEDARQTFDIKFYLVGILFVLFDLEIIFLFPWTLAMTSFFSFMTMTVFIGLLIIRLAYELAQRALDWT